MVLVVELRPDDELRRMDGDDEDEIDGNGEKEEFSNGERRRLRFSEDEIFIQSEI